MSHPPQHPTADPLVRRSVLPSGMVVVTEEMPHARTAAIAILTRQGSRDERPDENGLSHFLEHFVFRGTLPWSQVPRGRTLREVAEESDLLGGEVDAWTGRESTFYGAEVAADLLPRALTLIADLVARPALPEADMERERSVIREERRGYEEDPAERAFTLSAASWWRRHALGRRIEGSARSLAALTHADVASFWQRKHVGPNLLAVAAGPLSHAAVTEQLQEALGERAGRAPRRGRSPQPPVRGMRVERRARLEQAQVLLALPGLPAASPEMPAMAVMATALGGGTSSRLWQRIREEEGLAYSLSLDHDAYRDCGRLTFHAVTAAEHVERVLADFHEEVRVLREAPLRDEEFGRVVLGLRSGMLLDTETPADRLDDLAWGELTFGRPVSLEERLQRLLTVTPAQVLDVARKLLADPCRQLTVVTPSKAPIDEIHLGP